MPRTYIKQGLRCNWTKDDLNKAVEDVKANTFTIRAAARAYQIPRSTLQQYVNSNTRKHQLSAEHSPGKVGRYPVLGKDFEKELCEHAKQLSDLYFGITKEQMCKLAYELAWKNGIRHVFNVDKQSAGDDWFQGFIERNPTISLRKPESTSIARVIGFRRSEVSRFFENLAQVFEKEKIDASRIYNIDETGMSTVQQQKQKILAQTGKKQIGKIVSAEKGETITAVVCISASGTFIPPMLIFPRKNLNPRLLTGAPPGCIGATSPSGWINGELYLKWLNHFIKQTGASVDRKVLLILDNHESHVTLQAWSLCRENGVIVVSLPPHCSHKCQPLDLTVFGPLKTAYYKRCSEWMTINPGKRITQYEVATLFGDAYCATASIQKCVNGFRAAGIYPLNSAVFTDEDFRAAENLIPKAGDGTAAHTAVSTTAGTVAVDPVVADTTAVNTAINSGRVELAPAETASTTAGTSTVAVDPVVAGTTSDTEHATTRTPATKKRVSVIDISPLPLATPKETTRRSKCKRSEVFTASPMKLILETKASKKEQRVKNVKKVDNIDPAENRGKRKTGGQEQKESKRLKTSVSSGVT
jgi:DDE superfamily endonuclease/helix-turn-helix, Psq domain